MLVRIPSPQRSRQLTAFLSTTSTLANSLTAITQHAPYMRQYFEYLALPPLLPSPNSAKRLPATLTKGIRFENVGYQYPRAAKRGDVIKDVSFSAEPGELVAIVGDNGAGKTTLIHILIKFFRPRRGSVYFDDIDIEDCDPKDVRKAVAVLFQDYARYQFSLRESILIGSPSDQPASDERLLGSVRAAGLGSLVESLPNGIDSQLGALFPGGRELSGGQWQRIALARLFYRLSPVLVLDEPTSSLDAEGELATFNQIRESLRQRIGIIISHRFSTVRLADKIVVLSEGRILEVGTYDALIEVNGRYAKLFALQAEGYRS